MKKLLLLSACALAAVPLVEPVLGVGTSNWSHTSENDFKSGTFDNVVATNLGDLKLSRAVRTLLQQNPRVSSVNSMVQAPDGTIYAGTGPHGRLLKIKGDEVSEVAEIEGATHLFALALDKDGALLIGTAGESGRVLKLGKPGEKPVEVFRSDGVQYVWNLAQTDDGKIYAATGPNGQLFEITGPGQSRIVFDANENNLLSLISDGKDMLYVGTDPNGLIYRINRKTGENFIVYDAPESEISALLRDEAGNIYAGTSEARDEPQVPRPPAPPTAGRPESQPAGVPIPSQPPSDPEPPKVPDPNPGQPDPIPRANPATPEKTEEKPAEAKPESNDGAKAEESKPEAKPEEKPAPSAPEEGKAEGSDEKAQSEPKAPVKAAEPSPQPSAAIPGEGDKQRKPVPVAAQATSPTQPPAQKPTPGPAGVSPRQVPPGMPRPTFSGSSTTPGRPPSVDATGAGQPRPDGNAIYRIDSEGFVTEVFRQRAIVLGMVEKDGVLFVATGGEGHVYQVNPAQEETIILAKVEPKQVTCLLPAKDGNIYLGMANVGGIASIGKGYAQTGTYTSPVLDATQISRFGKMQLHGSLPAGTTLTVSTRSGNVKDATQASWSAWSNATPAVEFVQVGSPTARFLQYRLTFTSGAEGRATPVVEDVSVAYQVPNLPPQVRAVRLVAQPEQQAPQPPGGGGDGPEPARIPRAARHQIAWEAVDPNSDQMSYTLHFRRGPKAPWLLLRENISENQFAWDTRAVADGRYEVRVTASDARANPPGKGRTSARVSDPVVVDNTAPVIGSVRWQQNGAAVDVNLKVIDRTSIVSAVDYAVNAAKGWQAVLPSDSIFDSPDEAVSFSLPALPAGSHQVMVRATDSKGNQAFESIFVNVEGAAAKNE